MPRPPLLPIIRSTSSPVRTRARLALSAKTASAIRLASSNRSNPPPGPTPAPASPRSDHHAAETMPTPRMDRDERRMAGRMGVWMAVMASPLVAAAAWVGVNWLG